MSESSKRRDRREELGATLRFAGRSFDIVGMTGENGEDLEFVIAGDSVRVYPVDSRGNLLLQKEIRPGFDNVFLRPASGGSEVGEAALDTAIREAHEELGTVGGRGTVFHSSTANLKVINTITHVLLEDWERGDQRLEPNELIEPFVIHMSEVPRLVWSGEIAEDPVALALLILARRFGYKVDSF